MLTGGKSAQALKLLKAFQGDQVVLADYGDIPAFSSSNYQLISLGERNEETIAHNLLSTCLDLGVERLLPLCRFELEAVVKSAVLFEEFNIHVLLPDMEVFAQYPVTGEQNSGHWAVYDRGALLFSTFQAEAAAAAGIARQLNGAFYLVENGPVLHPVLFTIA